MIKAAVLVVALCVVPANAVSNYSGSEIPGRVAASAFNQDIDVSAFSNLSIQIDFADAAPAAKVVKPADISVAANTLTVAAHGLPVGLGVVLSTAANASVGGLSHGSTYYVLPVDDNTIKLADTAAHAVAGTNAIDITTIPSFSSGTITLTPQPLASSSSDGIAYQGSNDGVTFYSLSQSSVPYDAVTTGALTSFLDYPSKYVRLKFTGPSTGALSIKATLNGRR